MLLNLSYKDNKIKSKINKEVGDEFNFIEKFKLRGNGSPKLLISDCSSNIDELLSLNNNIKKCNIELRKKGIIIRFRSLLETYGLIVPYYKLKIFKGKKNEISLYKDNFSVKLKIVGKDVKNFFKKLKEQKYKYEKDFSKKFDNEI
ncbi:MAG: hypothetical protein ACJ0P1_08115 [Flavobacteriaceae bacterium]|tara:strand:+ start:761 stop:1198 length:438 start_codon:yes stop_codon:yes gene_type:complete